MFKSHFKSAWRNLKTNKFYSIINIAGLAVGLATGIILLLWVQDEMSYNKFNKDYQDIYQLSAHFPANGHEVTWSSVPGPLAVFAQSIPQVKSIVRIYESWNQVLANEDRSKVFDGFHIAAIDSSFLAIFDFKLEKGNAFQLFPDINAIILTQATAKKFFGNNNAMGKTIIYDGARFTVSGILRDFPKNSSLRYDALFPMSYYAQRFAANGGNAGWKTIDEDLGNYSFNTFVKLLPGVDPSKIGSMLSALYKKARNGKSETQFRLQNLADIHLVGADGNDAALRMVQLFMLVAILLLIIASINYINLSTARSMIRYKEVGIRKIIGANKKQLFLQFITETFLLFCVAIVLAVLFMTLFMPLYNSISGKEFHFSTIKRDAWEVIGWAVVGTLVAAGIYPALLLSSFRPIQALQGKVAGIGTAFFRKMLVVFQFIVSVILIVSTLVISQQMRYVRNKNIGYDKNYVFRVPLTPKVVNHIDAVKNELSKQQGIVSVSTSNIYDMSALGNATGDINWPGKPANSNMVIGQAVMDKDFIPTMKMQFIAGKNFSGTPADSAHYIVNEAMIKAMGLQPPYIGQSISFHNNKGTIIGVLKDFNFKSLKKKITPLLFYSWDWKGNMLYVRTTARGAQHAIAAVKDQYKRYAGDIPFSYDFIDKQFEAKYKSDQRAGTLFNFFAGIAIFISCLGLLGLATFTAQRRTKEIGIRKVLGASVVNIIKLISIDFLKLVFLAIIIAIPLSWLAMNNWLQNFAYRTNISGWTFVVAGLLAISIALLTVSWQAVRVARANPVEALRRE